MPSIWNFFRKVTHCFFHVKSHNTEIEEKNLPLSFFCEGRFWKICKIYFFGKYVCEGRAEGSQNKNFIKTFPKEALHKKVLITYTRPHTANLFTYSEILFYQLGNSWLVMYSISSYLKKPFVSHCLYLAKSHRLNWGGRPSTFLLLQMPFERFLNYMFDNMRIWRFTKNQPV